MQHDQATDICLIKTNWGYQIYDRQTNTVICAIYDTEESLGPNRTEKCTTRSENRWKTVCDLYAGVTQHTQRQILYKLLASHDTFTHLQWFNANRFNGNALKPLLRSGKIERHANSFEVRLADPWRTQFEKA